MAKIRKKMSKKKKIILIASITAGVAAAGVAAFFFIRYRAAAAMAASMTKTVQSAQAATGSISNSVTGTGTLAEDDARRQFPFRPELRSTRSLGRKAGIRVTVGSSALANGLMKLREDRPFAEMPELPCRTLIHRS